MDRGEDPGGEQDVAVEELGTLALTTVDSVVVRRNTDEEREREKGRKRWWRRVFGRRRKEGVSGEAEEVVDMPNYVTEA
jgi:hypothetical protein